jgi:hypothetical protein
VRSFLSADAQYREKGRAGKTSRLELAIKRHVAAALNGDVGGIAMLLKIRAHRLKFGDTGPLIKRIVNALPRSLRGRRRGRVVIQLTAEAILWRLFPASQFLWPQTRDHFEASYMARQLSSKTRPLARNSFKTCAGRAYWMCGVQGRPQDKILH